MRNTSITLNQNELASMGYSSLASLFDRYWCGIRVEFSSGNSFTFTSLTGLREAWRLCVGQKNKAA